jgi:hypothetical protein
LEREFVHDAQNLLVRLNYARSVEVLADFSEHVAPIGIERAHGEGIRVLLARKLKPE